MSRSAPVTLARHSVRADVRGKKPNLLRPTGRATQLVRKVFSERAVIWAELFNQPVNIKLFAVLAPVAIRRQQMPVALAIAQCRVRAECTHDSLQGGTDYSKNIKRTNHNLKQEGAAIRNHAF